MRTINELWEKLSTTRMEDIGTDEIRQILDHSPDILERQRRVSEISFFTLEQILKARDEVPRNREPVAVMAGRAWQ